jgi:hypothetical protein
MPSRIAGVPIAVSTTWPCSSDNRSPTPNVPYTTITT